MIERALYPIVFADAWGRQMRFISGPRQAGKTTLAKAKLAEQECSALYYLWDLRKIRDRYRDNELFFTADIPLTQPNVWVCFDEIHKMPKWKNILKGVFDETGDRFRFMITGSAKLNLLKRAGDSLAGRYFTFHLLPLLASELVGRTSLATSAPESAATLIEQSITNSLGDKQAIDSLLTYGGFPEPYLSQSQPFYRKWSGDYLETVIREDIGSLTRIVERESIYQLYQLLPEMAGSPLSESSLASHLQISPVTVKNYLRRLEDFYLGFSVPPYSRNIKRSLLKARKFYLFDWVRLTDPAARYENFIACQLKARMYLWRDASGEAFDLFYVRNKQKQETDFLLVREGKPWLLVETKLSDGPVDSHHKIHAEALGGIPVVQLCREHDIAAMQAKQVYRISASRMLL
ncbi:MAG TPA: ATP-binding protein [Kiritimatiellia bacterium]|nr:ATP-binding protein [Kiritimatiellia bacterium]